MMRLISSSGRSLLLMIGLPQIVEPKVEVW